MDANKYLELSQKKELVNTLGYEIMRDILIPELIGDNHNILYWAGKRLAREIFLAKDEDLPIFFQKPDGETLSELRVTKNNNFSN